MTLSQRTQGSSSIVGAHSMEERKLHTKACLKTKLKTTHNCSDFWPHLTPKNWCLIPKSWQPLGLLKAQSQGFSNPLALLSRATSPLSPLAQCTDSPLPASQTPSHPTPLHFFQKCNSMLLSFFVFSHPYHTLPWHTGQDVILGGTQMNIFMLIISMHQERL